MTVSRSAIGRTVEALLTLTTARRVTNIVSEHLTITATRRFKHDGRNTRTDIALTIGAPNYGNQMFIKAAVRAGEPFPIRKLRVTYWLTKAQK